MLPENPGFSDQVNPTKIASKILVKLAKTYPTPAALRDFFVANPEEFNRILHNARPDALEIQDIVQFYFVLLDRIKKYITENAMETD